MLIRSLAADAVGRALVRETVENHLAVIEATERFAEGGTDTAAFNAPRWLATGDNAAW